MRFLLLLALATNAFGAGLGSYPHLLVADSSGAAPRNGVRVAYLGTNGYQFELIAKLQMEHKSKPRDLEERTMIFAVNESK
jgi:hypothetical protein